MHKNIACVILAAGKGERMKSSLAKVLHQICGRPMIAYVLDLAQSLKPRKAIVVVGHQHQQVRQHLRHGFTCVLQPKLLGTADAVKIALRQLSAFKGTVLVLYGDIPLLTPVTIKKLLAFHHDNNLDATLLTAKVEKPQGYGRILRDACETISGIVEEKDANEFELALKEINTGIIAFNCDALKRALRQVKQNIRKKEFYLTDVISIMHASGNLIGGVRVENADEAIGINSRVELASANKIMQTRINEAFMRQGVSIVDPASTFIDYGVKIGNDTVIYPFTVIENNVTIGSRCSVGPFLHVRAETRIADNVVVGNFLEIARTSLSSGTFVKHFGYLGDSRVGRQVNIGAGVVTANFDGKAKHITTIKDHAFVGSDTVCVAPVEIGAYAVTGAGSVVTRRSKVPRGSVVAGVPARPLVSKKTK